MARRTRNGASDPYIRRRAPRSHQRGNHRQAVVPVRGKQAGVKDDAETGRALAEIGRSAADKEYSIATSAGPHSTPSERHYPKSFRIPVKKEDE